MCRCRWCEKVCVFMYWLNYSQQGRSEANSSALYSNTGIASNIVTAVGNRLESSSGLPTERLAIQSKAEITRLVNLV